MIWQMHHLLASGKTELVAQREFPDPYDFMLVWPPPAAVERDAHFAIWHHELSAKHPHPEGCSGQWVVLNEHHTKFMRAA